MTSRSRYILVTIGIIAFLVLSPFIVLYVTGTKYDSESGRFIRTGTFSVRTNPRGATVLIDNVEKRNTPANIRFIEPGDYDFTVRKEGYFDWSKRLNVRGLFVTWANKDLEALTLFYQNPERTPIASGVLSLTHGSKQIAYITSTDFYRTERDSSKPNKTVKLPASLTSPATIQGSSDEQHYIIQSGKTVLILDIASEQFFDISALVAESLPVELTFSTENKLYILESGVLSEINWQNNSKEPVLRNIIGFLPHRGAIYSINSNRQLTHTQLPSLDNTVLLENLPIFQDANLFITDQNQIFILADQNLYSVTNSLTKVADYVKSVDILNEFESLIYATANEVGIYDPYSHTTNLITRSSKPIKNPTVALQLGWSFFINDNRLQALEIDNRDHQNNYTFAVINENATFTIDPEAQYIFLLNNGTLERLKVR